MSVEMTGLFGRKQIFTAESVITQENIVSVLTDALTIHSRNKAEIEYLKAYEKGDQPILSRVKLVRPEISFKIAENHAAEITSFKVGYLFGSPISLIQRGKVDVKNGTEQADDERIAYLNEMLFEEDKQSKDQKLGEEMAICGVGYRLIYPKRKNKIFGITPFDIINLVSENTFVVRSGDIYKDVVLGVTFTKDEKKLEYTFTAYTNNAVYTLKGNSLVGGLSLKDTQPNPLGMVPIIEYPYNSQRQGCFEKVIPLLDALNTATSDRLNGLAQHIQELMWFNNCQIDEEKFQALKDMGAILTKSEPGQQANVAFITQALNQQETQTLIDYLYDCVLQIAGVPSRKTATGGNTGQAIQLAGGWETAEAMARSTEQVFKLSDKEALKIILKICNIIKTAPIKDISISDVDIQFSRSKNDNASVKIQNLVGQLNAGIHPRIAIANCGLFSDAEQTYIDSLPYLKKWEYDEKPKEDEPDAGN